MKQGKWVLLRLDIGTDSIGYAVTDEQYHLLKDFTEMMHGEAMCLILHHCDERRGFRSVRRRLDRRHQRVELFRRFLLKK